MVKSLFAIFCLSGLMFLPVESSKNDILLQPLYTDNDSDTLSKSLCKYTNSDMGFEMNVFDDMKVDNYLEGIVTNISNDDISISVFYDDFTDSTANYDSYVNYANKFLEDKKNHTLIEESTLNVGGKHTHFLVYSRNKLARLKNDKNYYCSAEIKVTNKKVYTILARSDKEDIGKAKELISSFNVIGQPRDIKIKDNYFKNVSLNLNEATKEAYETYFSDNAKLTWGIFENDAPGDFSELDKIEESIGYDFKFLIRYQGLTTGLPSNEIKEAAKRGKIVELSLQTMNTANGELDIYEILDGKYDEYFNRYAVDIKALNVPILFRLNNEMNGDWCHYCAWHYAKDASLYVEAWRYIYRIFERNGVDNVLWVWNPNHMSFPDFSYNNELLYYPGDEFVDIVGLTAYNTGNYYKGEKWSSFDELYSEYYREYDRIFEKSLMICEFGSSVFGGNKVAWVEDMFSRLKDYPNIKVAIWWSHVDFDANEIPARVYSIDNPYEVMGVFRKYIEGR